MVDIMDLKLQGKRALVTGSNSGIGAGIARKLVQEGVAVIIHGREEKRAQDVAAELRDAGGGVAVVVGNLETVTGAEHVAGEALAAFGGIDILVNNVGGRADEGAPVDFFDIDEELWNATFNLNVTAAVRLIRRLAGPMKARGWGRIIQIGSFSALAPSGSIPEFSSSKSGLLNLTLSLSKTLGKSGITVNSVSPGLTATRALDQWLDNLAKQKGFGSDREKAVQWVLDGPYKQTVGRLGTPEDIGGVVAFLCSPLADLINGTNIHVDGGVGSTLS